MITANDTISYRRMEPGDISAVMQMASEAPGIIICSTEKELKDFLLRCPWGGHVAVDTATGRIVACGFITFGVRYEINHLVVDPAYRNRGIAEELVRGLLGDSRRNSGAHKGYAVVVAGNKAGESLFNRLGFEVVARGKEIVLMLHLPPEAVNWWIQDD